jgi:hypothetical protein
MMLLLGLIQFCKLNDGADVTAAVSITTGMNSVTQNQQVTQVSGVTTNDFTSQLLYC